MAKVFRRIGEGKGFAAAAAATLLVTIGLMYIAADRVVLIRVIGNNVIQLKTSKFLSIATHSFRTPKTLVDDKHEAIAERVLGIGNKHIVAASGRENVLKTMRERQAEGMGVSTILLWESPEFLTKVRESKLEFLLQHQCGGCQVTMDRSTLNKSVAVVMYNHPKLRVSLDIPDQSMRRAEQNYVFWSRETPSKNYRFHHAIEDKTFDSLFNLTMFYRRDADILQGFGNTERALRLSIAHKRELDLRSKTKLAIWIVSNCYPLYGAVERMRYVRKLVDAGLDVDKFGKCFGRSENPRSTNVRKYKFYLAFENSIHCPDYVSEKFWRNGLQAGLVPVVFGPLKSDVEDVAPNHSFIHVDDFNSAKNLVEYLRYLDVNDTAYMEYHQWRKEPINDTKSVVDIDVGHYAGFCRLCGRIVVENHPPKTIPSISKWLYKTRYVDDLCLKPQYKLSEDEIRELTNF